MRSAGEIKRELIRLLYGLKLPKTKIAQDSGCSEFQVWSALRLNATETVLRRLDAYLDAPHLHHHVKGTRLLKKIEMMREELWERFRAPSIRMSDFQLMSKEKQEWILNRMHWRAKRLLKARVKERTGSDVHFADGSNYWACKKKVKAKGISL